MPVMVSANFPASKEAGYSYVRRLRVMVLCRSAFHVSLFDFRFSRGGFIIGGFVIRIYLD